MSRKKHDTTPVTAAAELAHSLLGEEKDKPVSETRADWVEVLADTPAPDPATSSAPRSETWCASTSRPARR